MPKCLRCGEVGGHHAAGCLDAPRPVRLIVLDDAPRPVTPDEWRWLTGRLSPGEQPPVAEQGRGEPGAGGEGNAA